MGTAVTLSDDDLYGPPSGKKGKAASRAMDLSDEELFGAEPAAVAAAPVAAPPSLPVVQPERTWSGTAGDVANVFFKSAMAVPELAVGLLDIPTLGRAGKLVESMGIDFEEAKKASDFVFQSEAQHWAEEQVKRAQGLTGTVKAAIQNPSVILSTAGESAFPMLAGGVASKPFVKAVEAVPKLASLGRFGGAVGQGTVTAGSTAEQVRQQTASGTLTPTQAAIAATAGVVTGGLGEAGKRLSKVVGASDIDEVVAGLAKASPEVRKGILSRVLGGAAAETIEEMPQSAQEQVAQNIALGKPWDQGVAEAAGMGGLVGAAMGGGLQMRPSPPTPEKLLARELSRVKPAPVGPADFLQQPAARVAAPLPTAPPSREAIQAMDARLAADAMQDKFAATVAQTAQDAQAAEAAQTFNQLEALRGGEPAPADAGIGGAAELSPLVQGPGEEFAGDTSGQLAAALGAQTGPGAEVAEPGDGLYGPELQLAAADDTGLPAALGAAIEPASGAAIEPGPGPGPELGNLDQAINLLQGEPYGNQTQAAALGGTSAPDIAAALGAGPVPGPAGAGPITGPGPIAGPGPVAGSAEAGPIAGQGPAAAPGYPAGPGPLGPLGVPAAAPAQGGAPATGREAVARKGKAAAAIQPQPGPVALSDDELYGPPVVGGQVAGPAQHPASASAPAKRAKGKRAAAAPAAAAPTPSEVAAPAPAAAEPAAAAAPAAPAEAPPKPAQGGKRAQVPAETSATAPATAAAEAPEEKPTKAAAPGRGAPGPAAAAVGQEGQQAAAGVAPAEEVEPEAEPAPAAKAKKKKKPELLAERMAPDEEAAGEVVEEEEAVEEEVTEEEGVVEEEAAEEEEAELVPSKVPPEGVGQSFRQLAFTQRPSLFYDAWRAVGINAGTAANLPIKQQFQKLVRLYREKFGIQVVERKGAISRETVDSLLDGYRNITAMMHVLGLPQNAIGLNNSLTLVLEKFNAQKGYLGAYSPSEKAIYMPGRSNSFGHEWMHALDHAMAEIAGRTGDKLFSNIVRKEGANADDRLQGSFAELVNTIFHDHATLAWEVLKLQVKASARTKAGNPTPSAKKAQRELDAMLSGKATATKGIPSTEYQQQSAAYQPGEMAKYWTNPAEMLARAFEAYISSQRPKVPLNEFVSKPMDAYLKGVDDRFVKTFPKDAERHRIFQAFDGFFDALRVSNELGTGATATMPVGEGVFDPSRWKVYPNAVPWWQRMIQAEKEAYQNWRLLGWGESKTLAGEKGEKWTWRKGAVSTGKAAIEEMQDPRKTLAEGLRSTFAAQRGWFNSIYKRTGRSPAVAELRDHLFTERGEGRAVKSTIHESVSTRTRARHNDVYNVLRKWGITKLSKPENQLLRYIMVSAETMLSNPDVQAQIDKLESNIPDERIDKIEGLAADLRNIMDAEFYYNREAGIELGYTKNGHLPRVLNSEAFMDDKDKFEAQARMAYGAQFDHEVGTKGGDIDLEAFTDVARQLKAVGLVDSASKKPGMSQATKTGLATLKQLQQKRKQLQRHLPDSKDPDQTKSELQKVDDQIERQMQDMLPDMRQEYAAVAALNWRTALDTTAITDYDTQGPTSNYRKRRTLPPEADVLMQDFYIADPLDAIAHYLEQSTRRVEYAKRFGVKSEKLQRMLDDMRDQGVSAEERAILNSMVNNATGRENHSAVPSQFTKMMNLVNMVQTMYLLGRATFSSLSEPLIAFARTGNIRDIARPFGYMVQDVLSRSNALERRAVANLIGLVSTSYSDAMMANRLTGESYSRRQNKWMSQFFERTLLAPMTRAQQRSMLMVGQHYLYALVGKSGHKPSQAELRELGISDADQPGFAAWLQSLDGNLPQTTDLIDPNTNELSPYGQLYGTAIKRFSDQVIMEPSKMDRPRLSTNPVARFAFGIMSFQYTFWHQVQKPFIKGVVRNFTTLATGEKEMFNANRTRGEAALGIGLAATSLVTLYAGHFVVAVARAALLDSDRWEDEEKKGNLGAWLRELAFWRMGFAGPLDPLVQAVRGIKYQRDMTSLTAGPQLGALMQNIQDISGWAVQAIGNLISGEVATTNTQQRKAAKAFYNLMIGPVFSFAAAATPAGPAGGAILGMVQMFTGSGGARDAFASWLAGEKFDKETQKREKTPEGGYTVREKTPSEIRRSERAKRARERKKEREARRAELAYELEEAD